ncbi:DNA integrity scanning diadenylate cyclase DisA [Scrofimicrobium sp. R131]|uniref:DNA integrity scanning diadenylate cyclase DisA n=1 Tax=Scrofimicrobium appendicitidis TaxID=3079930 RepID=A0AAU7VAA8_9ACTO
MGTDQQMLRHALRLIAPGTELREGIGRIQKSHTGAVIVLGYNAEVEKIASGGFTVNVEFSPARLRELCKMDGAVVVDVDQWIIRRANVQLMPDPSIPTDESGTRHRTAQRTARQASLPVLSVSSSMKMISIYVGDLHHTVVEPEALLVRANQAVDTLDRYTQRLDEVMSTLSIFEMRDSVTIRDVATVVQRMEMIRRITSEINEYIEELGVDGRLLALQVDDLQRGAAAERTLVLRDYIRNPDRLAEAEERLAQLSADSLVDLAQIANILGLAVYDSTDLDSAVSPRGIQALSTVPRLPWQTIQAIINRWPTLTELKSVTTEELQEIEGIGPYRAQMIVEQLHERHRLAYNLG